MYVWSSVVIMNMEKVQRWCDTNMKAGIFLFEYRLPKPGDRVLELDRGRIGTVVEGIVNYSCAVHPTIIYDDEPSKKSTTYNTGHFYVFKDEFKYGEGVPPITW